MPIERILLGGVVALATLTAARADEPLSAIDWLSDSVATSASATGRVEPGLPEPAEPPVAGGGAMPEDVATTVLGAGSPDAIGLLSPQVTGLPRALWGLGRTDEIAALLTAERVDALPALKELFLTIILAEADPPADSGGKGVLLRSRIDKLLALGALDQAAALLDASGAEEPELFRRAFDVALLTGTEDRACDTMQALPNLAPTFPARIFCLARSGDWNAAALTLQTAEALGHVTADEADLMARFLDPDLFEGEPPPLAPERLTPLSWRMFEAIGEPLPTQNLPLAFAFADLSQTSGWKAQLEAAERLARAGALPPNRLLGLYTEREAAASGGVWDRVDAFQAFDAAIRARDIGAVTRRLPVVWRQMAAAELEVPFAALYAEELSKLPLSAEAGQLAFRVGLLSESYERVAMARTPADPTEAFLIGLARGSVEGLVAPDSLGRAIAPAFVMPEPSAEDLQLLEEGRLGEAILGAIDRIGRGVQGELRGVTEGLSLLRHVGLEDAARRTALELMLLERRG